MSISDVASLIGGAALGAPISEIFRLVVEEAKKVKDFKPLSQDLASTMERLVPLFKDIESMQDGSNPGELKVLIETTQRAKEMVRKCSRVQWYDYPRRALYTRAIKGINQSLLRFCQIDFPIIHHRNMLQSMRSMANVSTKIDRLSNTGNELAKLFEVPQPETVTLFWLDQPLRELKRLLFEDRVVNVVVSAPSSCGKTMLVTKLCHDADVKGKFKQIFFVTLSIAPNTRLIVQRLLQRTGCKANEFANNLDAGHSIQQLLKQLGQNRSTLLVLDDVWPEEESLLDKLLIQLPDYKILVTSRFEFTRFGPTYHLEPLIDEDLKKLFTECTPQPNCPTCAKRDHHLQKILKRCNGSPLALNPPPSICDGCNSVIEHERPVNVVGVLWHPECFCCDACHKPIAVDEVENHVSNSRGKFHKSCYNRKHSHLHPNCYICKEKIPPTVDGILYYAHPFWNKKYCPSHEVDGTPLCFSCQQLEPRGTNYAIFGDGRCLCLECYESSILDTDECQPLHFDMREFFEGLNLKIEKEFPFLLVEKQALDEAEEKEFPFLLVEKLTLNEADRYKVVTRGICLSEEQTVKSVSRAPRFGPNMTLRGLATESQKVIRECEVTAILILYGLPRLLTGYILANEMMRAWLRLNGYRNLNNVLEEGLCQVLGHMWLETQTYSPFDKGLAARDCPDFEKKLVEFCLVQIETNDSPVYGLGFKKVQQMMVSNHYSLLHTLKDIISISKTTPYSKF